MAPKIETTRSKLSSARSPRFAASPSWNLQLSSPLPARAFPAATSSRRCRRRARPRPPAPRGWRSYRHRSRDRAPPCPGDTYRPYQRLAAAAHRLGDPREVALLPQRLIRILACHRSLPVVMTPRRSSHEGSVSGCAAMVRTPQRRIRTTGRRLPTARSRHCTGTERGCRCSPLARRGRGLPLCLARAGAGPGRRARRRRPCSFSSSRKEAIASRLLSSRSRRRADGRPRRPLPRSRRRRLSPSGRRAADHRPAEHADSRIAVARRHS